MIRINLYGVWKKLEFLGLNFREQAEVQAEVLTEAFNVNLESLVTKDFLESQLNSRFAEVNARIDYLARFMTWSHALILGAIILPYLQGLIAL
ncbi:MAG: hypothetical protein MI746_07330 [Pseudomonadales bacterium]|nr:hypothetical protein [Pseudomonadales bacterium]